MFIGLCISNLQLSFRSTSPWCKMKPFLSSGQNTLGIYVSSGQNIVQLQTKKVTVFPLFYGPGIMKLSPVRYFRLLLKSHWSQILGIMSTHLRTQDWESLLHTKITIQMCQGKNPYRFAGFWYKTCLTRLEQLLLTAFHSMEWECGQRSCSDSD